MDIMSFTLKSYKGYMILSQYSLEVMSSGIGQARIMSPTCRALIMGGILLVWGC